MNSEQTGTLTEDAKADNVHALFDDKLSTRELVIKYANEIKAAGDEPTPKKVLDLIFERTGRRSSPNLVTDELRKYREQAGKMAESVLQLQGIDAPFREVAVNLMGELIKVSRAIAEKDTAIYIEQANEKHQVMATRLEEAERRREHDQTLIASGNERVAQAKQTIADLQDQLTKTNAWLEQEKSALESLRGEFMSLQADSDRERKELMARLELVRAESKETLSLKDAEIERVQESKKIEVQKMRDLVATQIEQLDAFRKTAALETDRQRQVYAQEVESLRGQLTYESAKLGSANTRITNLENDVNELKISESSLKSELKAAQGTIASLKAMNEAQLAQFMTTVAKIGKGQGGDTEVDLDPYPLIESSVLDDANKLTLRQLVEEALEEHEGEGKVIFEKVLALTKLAAKNGHRAETVIDSLDKRLMNLLDLSTKGW
jgi:DNA repair exonuclease SbcCD ATPase subunit